MVPDPFNPFGLLGGAAEKVVADSWIRMMLSIWNAGIWLLKVILQMETSFLVPDISAGGPAGPVYQVTFWLGATLMVIMLMVQLGTAAVRRDGKSLGRILIGAAQFILVWAAWIAYGAAIIVACAALNTAFLTTMLGVDDIAAWEPWEPFTGKDVGDAVIATVLGWLGLLVWLAAIAHLLVMLTRAGALIVLAVTTPISAAGLVSDIGRSWFWKSLRWFHAAAFSPILMTLLMGTGIQLANAAIAGPTESIQSSIATALAAVVMILTSAASPMALFKLLAFTDPGTSSGAAVRAGMSAVGGLGGLLQGGQSGATTAAQTDGAHRSSGEAHAEAANTSRMMSAAGTAAGFLGPVGAVVGGTLKAFAAISGTASALTSDITNQMGVGHNTYQPDWIAANRQSQRPAVDTGDGEPHDQFDSTPADPTTPQPAQPGPATPDPADPPATNIVGFGPTTPTPPASTPPAPRAPGGAPVPPSASAAAAAAI